MAGVGRWPVPIPDTVEVSVGDDAVVAVGPKGELSAPVPAELEVRVDDGNVTVSRRTESHRARALHGLTRKLISNIIAGVSTGFSRTLELNGVGYRAEVSGDAILFSLGFSHPIRYQLPPGVHVAVERQTVLTLTSIDKQLVGEVAAGIRRLRPPDPYKIKGIKYAEEKIRKKAGKAAGAR